jgi:leader peptidase (prepilin peptidase) / N-methyltransferase
MDIKITAEIIIFILGSAIGSFLNVLIDRLPNNQLISGRSHCDYCRKKIFWYDLIPVLSFFILQGRTRCCKKRLSWQYPLIEMSTGIIFLLIFNFQFSIFNYTLLSLLALWGIMSCLIVIFISDLKYHLISDYIQAALLIFSVFFHLTTSNSQLYKLITDFIPSGLIVSLPIFLIYYFSKEKAMGLGDVFLAANLGFLLGWQAGFLALYISFVCGAVIGLIMIIVKNKKLKSKIAFGPFLVIGTVIMMFWQKEIFQFISRIYGS